ncbi:MAG TPA: hypothetical protein VLV83_01440 [Acidobacteriota bacterium]|nr:hypothetical protein [Acidobacteriota bacterium]
MAELRIKLIAPKLWRKWLSKAEDSMTEEAARRFLHSALSALHNRHVGVTVPLVAELADACLRPGTALRGPWADVQRRLEAELRRRPRDAGPRGRSSTSRGTPLLFHAAPSYVVLRLALPLAEKACRDMGVSYVFGQDERVRPPIAPPYSRYQARLRERLSEMASEDDPSMALFWKEAAWTLAGLSGRPAPLRTAAAQLSQVDPEALALLLRLTPPLPAPQPAPQRHPRPARASSPYRPALHRREGGVEGVHITRRQEEIDSILISEYANPPLLLTERVLNTGYLALHRPPQRETLRDVLVAGFMPDALRGTLSGDFLKACWFECMNRLALLLWQGGLRMSEFRWTEGDARGGARRHSYRLEALPESMPEHAADSPSLFRHAFLTALDWLPSFLDTRNVMRPLRGLSLREAGGSDASSLGRWVCAAWKQQQSRPLWMRGSGRLGGSTGGASAGGAGRARGGFARASRPGRHSAPAFGSSSGMSGGSAAESARGRYSRRASETWTTAASRTTGGRHPSPASDFGVVHLMIMLPARLLPQDAAAGSDTSSAVGRLFAELGLERRPGQSASVLWTPQHMDDLQSWRLQLRGRLPERLFPSYGVSEDSGPSSTSAQDRSGAPPPALLSQERIAARLIEAWLGLLRREVGRAG